jgi:hypothetical protein
VGEIAGADADITLWEFGMMGGTDGDQEQFIRSSILLPKQPHVLLCDTMEGARDGRDKNLEKRTDREWIGLGENCFLWCSLVCGILACAHAWHGKAGWDGYI